jgi:hypothetical protein
MKLSVQQWLCRLIAFVLIVQAPLAVATTCASSMQKVAEMSVMDMDCHGDETMDIAQMLIEHDQNDVCCDTCSDCVIMQSSMMDTELFVQVEPLITPYGMSVHQTAVANKPESPFRPPIV